MSRDRSLSAPDKKAASKKGTKPAVKRRAGSEGSLVSTEAQKGSSPKASVSSTIEFTTPAAALAVAAATSRSGSSTRKKPNQYDLTFIPTGVYKDVLSSVHLGATEDEKNKSVGFLVTVPVPYKVHYERGSDRHPLVLIRKYIKAVCALMSETDPSVEDMLKFARKRLRIILCMNSKDESQRSDMAKKASELNEKLRAKNYPAWIMALMFKAKRGAAEQFPYTQVRTAMWYRNDAVFVPMATSLKKYNLDVSVLTGDADLIRLRYLESSGGSRIASVLCRFSSLARTDDPGALLGVGGGYFFDNSDILRSLSVILPSEKDDAELAKSVLLTQLFRAIDIAARSILSQVNAGLAYFSEANSLYSISCIEHEFFRKRVQNKTDLESAPDITPLMARSFKDIAGKAKASSPRRIFYARRSGCLLTAARKDIVIAKDEKDRTISRKFFGKYKAYDGLAFGSLATTSVVRPSLLKNVISGDKIPNLQLRLSQLNPRVKEALPGGKRTDFRNVLDGIPSSRFPMLQFVLGVDGDDDSYCRDLLGWMPDTEQPDFSSLYRETMHVATDAPKLMENAAEEARLLASGLDFFKSMFGSEKKADQQRKQKEVRDGMLKACLRLEYLLRWTMRMLHKIRLVTNRRLKEDKEWNDIKAKASKAVRQEAWDSEELGLYKKDWEHPPAVDSEVIKGGVDEHKAADAGEICFKDRYPLTMPEFMMNDVLMLRRFVFENGGSGEYVSEYGLTLNTANFETSGLEKFLKDVIGSENGRGYGFLHTHVHFTLLIAQRLEDIGSGARVKIDVVDSFAPPPDHETSWYRPRSIGKSLGRLSPESLDGVYEIEFAYHYLGTQDNTIDSRSCGIRVIQNMMFHVLSEEKNVEKVFSPVMSVFLNEQMGLVKPESTPRVAPLNLKDEATTSHANEVGLHFIQCAEASAVKRRREEKATAFFGALQSVAEDTTGEVPAGPVNPLPLVTKLIEHYGQEDKDELWRLVSSSLTNDADPKDRSKWLQLEISGWESVSMEEALDFEDADDPAVMTEEARAVEGRHAVQRALDFGAKPVSSAEFPAPVPAPAPSVADSSSASAAPAPAPATSE